MPRTAFVLGGTGLVGRALVKLLLENTHFGQVRLALRRPSGLSHPKLQEHIVDFERPETWANLLDGVEVLFSCLGTTLKQAGSKAAQYKVDYEYQYRFAEEAARQSVPACVLVSSAGASEKSWFFYSRIKGELEMALMRLPFQHLVILQPSLLLGPREEERGGEKFGEKLLAGLNAIGLFKRYRGIEAEVVAKAMIQAALDPDAWPVYVLDEIFERAETCAQNPRFE